jgi:DNA-directed RNA polymerase sigma subunit (sigma70/sigma32)
MTLDIAGDLYLSRAIESLRQEKLGERLVRVLYLRFWQSLTLCETAEMLGISQARVRQIEIRALRLLKRKLGNTRMTDYFSVTVDESATICRSLDGRFPLSYSDGSSILYT